MAGANIRHLPDTIGEGGIVTLTAAPDTHDPAVRRRVFHWTVEAGKVEPIASEHHEARWDTTGLRPGSYAVRVEVVEYGDNGRSLRQRHGEAHITVTASAQTSPAQSTATASAASPGTSTTTAARVNPGLGGSTIGARPPGGIALSGAHHGGHTGNPGLPIPLPVTLQRARHTGTRDRIFWSVLRNSAKRLSFDHYKQVMDRLLAANAHDPNGKLGRQARSGPDQELKEVEKTLHQLRGLSMFYDPYQFLKLATEAFVMLECRVHNLDALSIDVAEEEGRFEEPLDGGDVDQLWYGTNGQGGYLETIAEDGGIQVLPYLAIIQRRLPEVVLPEGTGDIAPIFNGLREKLQHPCFLELIWSYWHEEAGLAQTLNHISERFQNARPPGAADPLANLELDPLMPLNSVLWGYVQDDLSRTSVIRRASEYAHEYGFTLQGKAVRGMRVAERRSKFLESFHNLLNLCVRFFRQDDNTTVVADGFPVLNAIKETHYLLAQGASNQFGGLTTMARQEMLLQQWLLARPEMREFLGGRVMVPYPEPWMDRVDSMKALQGWTDVSVVHFHDLAVFGEQLLLGIRYGAWSTSNDPNQAANWARYWRPEIQGYIHAYRAVTGVDLTSDVSDPQQLAQRYLPPSVLLQNRMAMQRRRRA